MMCNETLAHLHKGILFTCYDKGSYETQREASGATVNHFMWDNQDLERQAIFYNL